MQHQKNTHKKYLFLVCFIAAIGGFLFGFDTAVISGALVFVTRDFQFSPLMEGWFVSSALLGCIIGVAFSGRLSDVYGRKRIMLLSAILFFLSAIGCMLSTAAAILIGFRFIGGLGIGVASMICPLYISEFSPPNLRGKMVSLYQLAITIGIVIAYFSNAYILNWSASHSDLSGWLHYLVIENPWRAMIGIGLIPSFCFLVCLSIIPESPRWLILNGKTAEAIEGLQRITDPVSVQQEIILIQKGMQEDKSNFKALFSPTYRNALIIGICLPFLSQVCGINAVIYYGPTILDQAGFSVGDAFGGQVIIGLVNVIFTFVAIFTVDRWGRKPLLYTGIIGAVISLLSIGILFKFTGVSPVWILFFIMFFIACFAFSFGPVCWIVISEIFPSKVRGQAMSLAILSLWVANFLVGQLTPIMLKSPFWGPSATFWTFALLCAPGLWLTYKLIPETKGQSLEQIESFWKKKYLDGNNK